MRKSDFREDREFSYDPPSDESTLTEKLAWQRKLEAQRQNAELPSDLPEVAFNEKRWWCIPGAVSPEYQQQQLQRHLQRLKRSE